MIEEITIEFCFTLFMKTDLCIKIGSGLLLQETKQETDLAIVALPAMEE